MGEAYESYMKTDAYGFFKGKVQEWNRQRPDAFDYFKTLGTMNNSKVFMARKQSTGRLYAVKIYSKRALMKRHFMREKNIHVERLCSYHCGTFPFVVSLAYAMQTEDHALLAYDYCEGGDLEGLLESFEPRRLPKKLLRKVRGMRGHAERTKGTTTPPRGKSESNENRQHKTTRGLYVF